ncbi:HisA/HisF-related TIM barrel protein [Ancylobacter defluvii]|uniref:HisA/HisF-related TIM barrel protein n=1 Tax=Ancylobacter defluvii TaxID=1282440 RepID=UPI001BD08044|nr:HisA/HisF-related TIM barrel protein [Ancylobacter defluvii]MBS7589274.1 nickel transporter [Ancylobacter defluvii]
MELIPVIDLMGGVVVHARRGDRANYRPIASGLCEGAEPVRIAQALRELAPFRTLYVADLDAIAGREPHRAELAELAQNFERLWIDAGEVRLAGAGPGLRRVLGTESMGDAESGRAALREGASVLSLDHGPEGRRGPAELHERAELWPDEVIVMTLARVGGDTGPDYDRLRATLARAEGRRIYAAGGVRDAEDLRRLADLGIAGVLLASALHDGRLGAADLAAVMG